MNIISQTLESINKYGRAKLYEKNSNGNQCELIDLFIDKDGKLKAIKKIEVYDIPYLKNGVFDETAELNEIKNVAFYKDDDINIILAYLIIK